MSACLLTVENKCNHMTDSMASLALSRRNPSEFLHRYITVDGTWIHFYHVRDKGTDETVDNTRRTSPEEGEGAGIDRQNDENGFFNARTTKGSQNDLFDMVEVGIPQSSVVLVLILCDIIGPAGKRNQEKTLFFGKEKSTLSSGQWTRADLCCSNGIIARIKVQIVAAPTVLGKFEPP